MGEIIKKIVEWVLKKTGLKRKAFFLGDKFSGYLAKQFSGYGRRGLIILLFVSFLILSGSWKEVWQNAIARYLPQSPETNGTSQLVSSDLFPAIASADQKASTIAATPKSPTSSTNRTISILTSNGTPIFKTTSAGTFVFTTNGPLLILSNNPSSSEKSKISAAFAKIKDDWDRTKWYLVIWNNIGILLSIVFSLFMAFFISVAITTIADTVGAGLRTEFDNKLLHYVKTPTASPAEGPPQAAAADLDINAATRTLTELLEESVIPTVYGALEKREISSQEYASDIIAAVKEASTLRLLTIAGFEYIGRGADSL